MGTLEQGGKVASEAVAALRGQPLALALVVVNVLFLIGVGFMLREVSQAVQRKDVLLSQLAERCLLSTPKKD
ncbi:hypothetical protein ACVWZM_000813 [Bradyrhizobium sp. USDA 4501]